jgi:hypothetical protein
MSGEIVNEAEANIMAIFSIKLAGIPQTHY